MDPARLSDWPMSAQSRLVRSRPHIWHLQEMGAGPDLLLIHGTGASTHSWHGVLPRLAERFRVLAVDLPGHGFTRLGTRFRSSLETVSDDLAALIRVEGYAPRAVIAHSAGVAVALRLTTRLKGIDTVIGINPALEPFQGLAGVMFPMVARMMAITPGMVDMLAWSMAQPGRVEPLLAGTGSEIDDEMQALYARLFRDRGHVEGTLQLMAQWKLDGLQADLPQLATPALFITGSMDRMVPPVSAVHAASRMPDASVLSLDGYGHLVHEEAPDLVTDLIAERLGAA